MGRAALIRQEIEPDRRLMMYANQVFAHPVRIRDGRYVVPDAPGYSIEMHAGSIARFSFPGGDAWRSER